MIAVNGYWGDPRLDTHHHDFPAGAAGEIVSCKGCEAQIELSEGKPACNCGCRALPQRQDSLVDQLTTVAASARWAGFKQLAERLEEGGELASIELDQLREMHVQALRLGCYDAAMLIGRPLERELSL